MQATLKFSVVLLFCLALAFVSGCGNKDKAIAKKDLREINEYEKGNSAEDVQKYLDMKRAEKFEVWKRAAEKGIPEGQVLFGMCHVSGVGVPQDEAVGVNWWRKAAEQGCVEAQLKLIDCYRNGFGVPQDEAEAVKWLHKAAEHGTAEMQFNLGMNYLVGNGVPQNRHGSGKVDSQSRRRWICRSAISTWR